jgi:hypothetical protein
MSQNGDITPALPQSHPTDRFLVNNLEELMVEKISPELTREI